MTGNAYSIVGKAIGTLVLALGLVVMVGRAPFLPEREAISGDTPPGHSLQNVKVEPGIMQRSSSPLLSPPFPEKLAGIDAGLGLYKARFAATDSMPGFATEEHEVEGSCTGAGRRYLEETCPGCELLPRKPGDASPPMLMWKEKGDGSESLRAVSTDCISIGPTGLPVVGTLQLGDGVADLSAGRAAGVALDVVPLVPGASRLAAVEIGNWFATFDNVVRPSSAVGDMARALASRGWREVSGTEGQSQFEGERVFTNARDEVCVVTLSRQGDEYQLLTVVSLQT
ncbi:MAG TPA: hypothetical protein VFY27_01615 [Woeseiaceae bacterium]|nr:hypothetical protein [Woeseiaceae bacterium]